MHPKMLSTYLEDLHHVLNSWLVARAPTEVGHAVGMDPDGRPRVRLDRHDRLGDEDAKPGRSLLSRVCWDDGGRDPVERVVPFGHLLANHEIRLKLPCLSRSRWICELVGCERGDVDERDRVVAERILCRVHRPPEMERDEEGELGRARETFADVVHEVCEFAGGEGRARDVDVDADEGDSEQGCDFDRERLGDRQARVLLGRSINLPASFPLPTGLLGVRVLQPTDPRRRVVLIQTSLSVLDVDRVLWAELPPRRAR